MYINIIIISPFYRSFIENYQFVFILTLISLAVLILLRSKIVFLIQFAYLGIMLFINQLDFTLLMSIFLGAQIIFTLVVVYKIKKAIDRNYQLVLEKTHAIKRHITKDNYTGGQKSFFR